MRLIKYFSILFLFLSKVLIGYSQQTEASIDIIHFNSSATYAPGSGVSVHIDPKGVYELIDTNGNDGLILNADLQNNLNNRFILELSSPGGSFDNPTTLATVYDFYTPLINGIIPSDISEGDYRLRVRATKGIIFDADYLPTDNYSQPEIETPLFSIESTSVNFTNFEGMGSSIENSSSP